MQAQTSNKQAPTVYFLEPSPTPTMGAQNLSIEGKEVPLCEIPIVIDTPFVNVAHTVYIAHLSAYVKAKFDNIDVVLASSDHTIRSTLHDFPFVYPNLTYKQPTKLTEEELSFLKETSRITKGVRVTNRLSTVDTKAHISIISKNDSVRSGNGALCRSDMLVYAQVRRLIACANHTNDYITKAEDVDSIWTQYYQDMVDETVDKMDEDTPRETQKTRKHSFAFTKPREKRRKVSKDELQILREEGERTMRDFVPKRAKFGNSDGHPTITNRARIPDDEPGIWFPFSQAVSTPDIDLVPNFIQTHLIRCLGSSSHKQVREIHKIREVWKRIAYHQDCRVLTHIVKCLMIALDAQGISVNTYKTTNSKRYYVGSAVLGTYILTSEGCKEGVMSTKGLKLAVRDTDEHYHTLTKIAVLCRGRYDQIMETTSLYGIRRVLLEKGLDDVSDLVKKQIVSLCEKLTFPNRKTLDMTLENIRLVLAAIDEHADIDTLDVDINADAVVEEKEEYLYFSLFGNLSPAVSIGETVKDKVITILDASREVVETQSYYITWVRYSTFRERMEVARLNREVSLRMTKKPSGSFLKKNVKLDADTLFPLCMYIHNAPLEEEKEMHYKATGITDVTKYNQDESSGEFQF